MPYDKQYYVYILTNHTNSVLYTGFTSDLLRRMWEHQHHVVEGFTSRYYVTKLVYFESTTDVRSAIERELQIKTWSRKRKDELVDSMNKERRDLYPEIVGE